MNKILIVGSVNQDIVGSVYSFPQKGETIDANTFGYFHGGKGANQAIACKRMAIDKKTKVSIFAKIKQDKFYKKIASNFEDNSIEIDYLLNSEQETGKAIIIISEKEQDNFIIVSNGANGDFGKEDEDLLEKAITENDLIVLQLETNKWLVENALKIAKKKNKVVFLNASPSKHFNVKWLKYIDWLVVNENELEKISDVKISNLNSIENAIQKLSKFKLQNIIVTLGSDGVYVHSDKIKKFYAVKKVNPVDTTAAGDTFIGTFISNYEIIGIEKCIKLSTLAASKSTKTKGAQNSIPKIDDFVKLQ